jgi:hypothetical protein
MTAIRPLLDYNKRRGMSVTHDIVDWIGGFPYEYARFDTLKDYVEHRGFELIRGIPANSLGCHQMVFRRVGS